MPSFLAMPFCYITVSLIVGILLARYFTNYSLLFSGLVFIFCIIITSLRKVEFLLSIAFIFIGNLLYILHIPNIPKQTTPYISKVKCTGVITSSVSYGVKHAKFILSTIKINEKRANLKLWVISDINCQNQRGEIVQIIGDLILPKTPKNPHEFDFREYLLTQNIVYILKAHKITLEKPATGLNKLHNHLIFTIYKHISSPSANLIEALITGNKYAIPTYIKEQFIKSGTYHLIVISGWHVGFLVFLCYVVLGWLGFGYRFRLVGCVLFSILFALFINLQPPAMRAIITAICILSGKLWSKKINLYNLVSFSAFVLLIINPFVLFDVSFQLTFGAVLGILKFSKPIEDTLCRICHLPRYISLALSATIAAQLPIIPILIYQFNLISTVTPIATLFSGVLVMVGVVVASISSIWLNFLPKYLLDVIVFGIEQMFTGLVAAVEFFANLPLSTIQLPTPPLIYALLYLGLLFFYNKRTLFKLLLLIFLVKANFDIYSKIFSPAILRIVCFSLPSESIAFSLNNQGFLLMSKKPNLFEFDYLKKYFVKENIKVKLVLSGDSTLKNQYFAVHNGLKVYSDVFSMKVESLKPLIVKIKFNDKQILYLKKYTTKDLIVEYQKTSETFLQRKTFSLKDGAVTLFLTKGQLKIKPI